MENTNNILDGIDMNIDPQTIIDNAGKLVETGRNLSTKDLAKLGIAVSAGALIGIGICEYRNAKAENRLPKPGILTRRNKVVDVDAEEVEEKPKKKPKKEKEEKK